MNGRKTCQHSNPGGVGLPHAWLVRQPEPVRGEGRSRRGSIARHRSCQLLQGEVKNKPLSDTPLPLMAPEFRPAPYRGQPPWRRAISLAPSCRATISEIRWAMSLTVRTWIKSSNSMVIRSGFCSIIMIGRRLERTDRSLLRSISGWDFVPVESSGIHDDANDRLQMVLTLRRIGKCWGGLPVGVARGARAVLLL